ncbi:hypothetical protein EAG_03102 [Camponotus floridanus]|uniref:Uncharacterized protein n=1 Tax=Camponotus floridanus TaxID=104421 RepID=E2ATG9_CAMFO|nr:hypothetical protein EAG_03102 [Camponotus floridanus]
MEGTTGTPRFRISVERSWREEGGKERWGRLVSPTGPLRVRLRKNGCGPRLTLGRPPRFTAVYRASC